MVPTGPCDSASLKQTPQLQQAFHRPGSRTQSVARMHRHSHAWAENMEHVLFTLLFSKYAWCEDTEHGMYAKAQRFHCFYTRQAQSVEADQ